MKLRIERVVYGGDGLARQPDGGAVFVPYTLPGELVEVGADAAHEMAPLHILESSSERVSPQCVHFGTCGGCQLQHASYTEQLRLKWAILTETLERAGIAQQPKITVHAAESWQYRNRIRVRLTMMGDELHVGYSRRNSNEFLPITMCPIAGNVLWRTLEAVVSLAKSDAAVHAWLRSFAEIELFSSADESKVQLSLIADDPVTAKLGGITFAQLCERLQQRAPVVGAGIFLRRGAQLRPGESWGTAGLQYEAAGEKYWVSRSAFFQINRFLIDTMVQLATDGYSGALAWDLYAGVGLFSRKLAQQFGAVTAVESAEPAVTDLKNMLSRLGSQHAAVKATTAEFLRNATLQRDRPELIVMDPPRAGLGAEVTELLTRIAAPRMVYVSCNPTTLGRDLKQMIDSGYRIQAMHLLDLFPQTAHLETITILEK